MAGSILVVIFSGLYGAGGGGEGGDLGERYHCLLDGAINCQFCDETSGIINFTQLLIIMNYEYRT